MQNIVSLQADRPRPQPLFDVPRDGARILFFTGVRYCRAEDEGAGLPRSDGAAALGGPASGRMLDAAAH